MRSPRRLTKVMVVAATVGVATLGVTAAVADQDEPAVGGGDDGELLERLEAVEAQLPGGYAELGDDAQWQDYADDLANLKGELAPLEDELRRLFVDGDEAGTEVATAVATVAAGWLDLMHAAESLTTWSSHDLAFPRETTDDDGVATGADDLRGTAERGLTLTVSGAARHLEGYTALRELSAADGPVQIAIDARAAAAEDFDRSHRPALDTALSRSSTTVLMPLERFETQGPGVESRAGSLSYVCVDRGLLEAETRPLTDEVLVELEQATPQRDDCAPPDLEDVD